MERNDVIRPQNPVALPCPQITTKFVIPSIKEFIMPDARSPVFPSAIPKSEFHKKKIQKGSWNEAEDELLFKTINELGCLDWKLIAKKVKMHTPKQCCERWLVKLNPNVRRTPFERWEDDIIIFQRQRIGNRWSLIAQLLPGRTSCSVKNRWYTVLRFRDQCMPSFVTQQVPCNVVFRNSVNDNMCKFSSTD